MRFLIAILLAAMASSGCAYGPDDALRLRWQGSPDGLVAARQAAGEWSGCPGVLVVVGDEGIPLVEVDRIVEAPGKGGATDLDDDGHVVRIRVVRYAEERATIAHEIGHAMGLGHAGTGIMAEHDSGARYVTVEDCAALR